MSDLEIMLFIRELDRGNYPGWEFHTVSYEPRGVIVSRSGGRGLYRVESWETFGLIRQAFQDGQEAVRDV